MLSFESNPQCREHVRLLQLTLTINITPIDITLCILEKNKSYKVMLKLILIFKCIMAPNISSAENSFSSVKTTIYLFFKYYPVENRLEHIIF